MAAIQLTDLRFSFPDEWHDRSIIAVSAPAGGWAVTPNFVVSRDLAKEDDSLEFYADRQLIELGKKLAEFKIYGRKPITVGDQMGVELLSTWKGDAQALAQQLVIVMRPNRQVLSFVCTAAKADFRKLSGVFEGILATVRV